MASHAEQRVKRTPGHTDTHQHRLGLRGQSTTGYLPSDPRGVGEPVSVGAKRFCVECGLFRILAEDNRCHDCVYGPENLTKERHKLWANSHADLVVNVLTHQTRAWHLYSLEDLAFHAERCLTHCQKYRDAGGRPDAE